jgi:glycosyltransferase involved in cell wall biosynthesis
MRIGLNLLHILPEISGGWNYIANLLAALGKHDEDNTYVAFVTKESRCIVPIQGNFETILIRIRSQYRPLRVFYENTVLQLLSYQYQLDCMHWFANSQAIYNTVPAVVTVYDLLTFLSRPFSLKLLYLRLMISRSAKRAPMLLPMSEFTASELQRILGVDQARMTVIPVILDALFRPADAEGIARFRAKYQLPGQFWLYVANMFPHKNHVRLFQAYHLLKINGFKPWPLILRGDFQNGGSHVGRMLAELGLEEEVIWLPRLERSEMPLLYSALVFPSLYEGGGMPVMEALVCGCPVAASDIPPIREYAGEGASYFDSKNIEAISQAMKSFQTNASEREHYRQMGIKRAETFGATTVIDKLLTAYHKACQK